MREFTVGDPTEPEPEAPEFALKGTTTSGDTWREEFICLRRAPAALAILMASVHTIRKAEGDQPGGVFINVQAAVQSLRQAIDPNVEGQRDRYQLLIEDPDRLVEATDIAEVVWWLNEQYLARPTSRQPASPNGALPSGPGSTPSSEPEASPPPSATPSEAMPPPG